MHFLRVIKLNNISRSQIFLQNFILNVMYSKFNKIITELFLLFTYNLKIIFEETDRI